MKIVIEIDDELLENASDVSGLKNNTAVVKLGLIMLIRIGLKRQAKIRRFRGAMGSRNGDSGKMRKDMRAVT